MHPGEGLVGDSFRHELTDRNRRGIDPIDRPATWVNRGDRIIYDSDWVRLVTSDVVMPDGTQVDHHVVRAPRPAAGALMVSDAGVLLIYRHRFITDTWGWEIPAGRVDDEETPAEAARREAREESGWEPRTVRHLCSFHPANGLLDQTFRIFVSDDAVDVGAPTDINEAARVEWVSNERAREFLLSGGVTDGLSFGAISYAFAAGVL